MRRLAVLLLVPLVACQAVNLGATNEPACQANSDCDDNNPCTLDLCGDNQACVQEVLPGEPCDDSDPCNANKTCDLSGICSGGSPSGLGLACDDDDACTTDSTCDEQGQCSGGNPVTVEEEPCITCSCDPTWGLECVPDIFAPGCGCQIYGKIEFVEAFGDFTVEFVDAFPDFEVQLVNSFADEPGEWEIVENFPDYKVEVVEAFGDFKIKYVDTFPDCNLEAP